MSTDPTIASGSAPTTPASGNGIVGLNPPTANAGVPVTAWEYLVRVCPVVKQEYRPEGRASKDPPQAIQAIANLRPINNLDWRKPETGGEEFIKDVKTSVKNGNLKAALVQLTGQSQVLEQACTSCVNGKGTWIGCVRAPASHPDLLPLGACANCAMFQHHDRCKPHSYTRASAFGGTLPLAPATQTVSNAGAGLSEAGSSSTVLGNAGLASGRTAGTLAGDAQSLVVGQPPVAEPSESGPGDNGGNAQGGAQSSQALRTPAKRVRRLEGQS